MKMRPPRSLCLFVLFVALAFAGSLSQGREAHAQFSIEIGISTAKAVRAVQNQGFDQIQVIRKGFSTVDVHACRGGKKYRVHVSDGYRVKISEDLGFCRNTVPIEAIQDNLRQRGYSRIVMENQNQNYVALACRDNVRMRLVFDRQGRLIQERQVGRCKRELEPNDVRQVLRDQGYNRIRFTDRQLPRYVAEACLDGRRYELVINRFGEIRNRNRKGRCARPINPDQLTNILREKGFDRIEIINNQPPVYSAQACLQNDRVALEINRFGTITSRRVIAACREEVNEDEIVRLLEQEGFTRIAVKRNRQGQFKVEACLEGNKKVATLSRYGELIDETDAGKCRARTVREIHERLAGRNFRDVRFYVEGCRNGRKLRFTYDKNGDRVGRERIGSC